MEIPYFPVITAQFVAKDDSIIQFQLFDKNVADVEDRNSPMSPGQGEYHAWFHADWRVPAEEPIVIEWSGDKKATIVGSTCTVTLVSPYDGALQPLYTTDPRQFCCLISRKAVGADSFSDVWFGWLDPEFYEEPFIAKKDYEVTLTFTDFGPLKRIIYDPLDDNTETLNSLLLQTRLQIFPVGPNYEERLITRISTTLQDGGDINVTNGGISIRTANFTDEDGETMTWYDVLEAVLKPLALRIEQRNGNLWVYDINALVTETHPVIDHSVFDGRGMHDGGGYPNNYWEVSPYNEWPIYAGDEEAAGTSGWGFVTFDSNWRPPVAVEWTSDDQMLSVDETFNHVRITFSPYAETVLFDGETEVNFEATQDFKPVKNGYDYDSDEEYESFQLSTYNPPSTADVVKGGLTVCGGTTMFKIKSMQSADDCEGVIAFLGGYNHNNAEPELTEQDWNQLNGDGPFCGFRKPLDIRQDIIDNGMTGQPLYRTRRILVPNAYGNPSLAWQKSMLKIQIPMLYDERYNPWEQAGSHNDLSDRGYGIKRSANSIGLRLNIRLYKNRTGGSPIRFYQNIAWQDLSVSGETVTMRTQMAADVIIAKAGWYVYNNYSDGTNGRQHRQLLPTLIMYNKFDGSKVASEDSPCLGGMNYGGMPFNNNCETDYYFRKNNDGLYVPFPNIGTDSADYQANYWLEVEVTDGLYIYDRGRMRVGSGDNGANLIEKLTDFYLKAPAADISQQSYGYCRWWLVGFPTIKAVRNVNKIYDDIEVDDIEQSGVIDAAAAEELSIDTVCGCCDSAFANGAYLKNGSPVTALRRASRTASAEQLLIGTLYSQYAGRHLKLNGTARAMLPLQGLRMLTDTHYPGKQFLVTSEVYNVIDGESELTMVEASVDSYTSE